MQDGWHRFAAEERVRQLEGEVAECRAMLRHATQRCDEIAQALGCAGSWDQGVVRAQQLRERCEAAAEVARRILRGEGGGDLTERLIELSTTPGPAT